MDKRRYLLLTVFVALALFPLGSLGKCCPGVYHFLNSWFPDDIAHGIGHSLIFFTLGILLSWVRPHLLREARLYFLVILACAIMQELLQLSYKRHAPMFDEFRDIAVDLCASALAFALCLWLARRGKSSSAL